MTSQQALEALAEAGLGSDTPAEAFLLGFEKGRDAPFTQDQIEAAAQTMYENAATRWYATTSSGSWVQAQPIVKKGWRVRARFALDAAREAAGK